MLSGSKFPAPERSQCQWPPQAGPVVQLEFNMYAKNVTAPALIAGRHHLRARRWVAHGLGST
eukprot:586155-Rhodomonas_salina.2